MAISGKTSQQPENATKTLLQKALLQSTPEYSVLLHLFVRPKEQLKIIVFNRVEVKDAVIEEA